MEGSAITTVFVQGNMEKAIKVLKRKLHKEGVFREMKRHERYEKPSEARARMLKQGQKRAEKKARKEAEAQQ